MARSRQPRGCLSGQDDPNISAPTIDTPRGPRPDSASLLRSMGLQDAPPQDGPAGGDIPSRARPLSARVRASRCAAGVSCSLTRSHCCAFKSAFADNTGSAVKQCWQTGGHAK